MYVDIRGKLYLGGDYDKYPIKMYVDVFAEVIMGYKGTMKGYNQQYVTLIWYFGVWNCGMSIRQQFSVAHMMKPASKIEDPGSSKQISDCFTG